MPVDAPAAGDQRWLTPSAPALVDRDEELELLARAVDDLRRGRRPGMVTVTGTRGSGLSAVVDALVDGAHATGLRVAFARCAPRETDLPFGLAHHLASCLHLTGSTLWTRRPATVTIPVLCAEFLAAARTRPLVVAVDDAQWADRESRAWLRALARRIGQAPLLLVQATTHTDPGPEHLTAARVLRLRPLDETAVREVITARYLGPVDRGFVTGTTAATGGSPAVLGAVLRHFAEAELPPLAEHVSVAAARAAAVVGDRAAAALTTLPADATALLRALVLCGDALGPDLARTLAGADTPGTLARLADLGLVVAPEDPRPASTRVREDVLAGMPAADRATLLRRAVELGRRVAIPDDRLATLLSAAPVVDEGWAVDVLVRVARRRQAHGDHRGAAELLGRALREPLPPAGRHRLLVDLGAVEVVTNPHAADRRLRQVLLCAAPDSDTAVLAADLLQTRGDTAAARRVMATACARGKAAGADTTEMAALGWLAENDCLSDDLQPVRAFPEPVTDPADPGGPVRAGVAAWALTLRGEHRAAARALARATLAAAGDPVPFGPRVHACRALLHADDVTAAVLGLDAVIADARRRGVPAAAALALLHRASCEHRRGNLAQAEDDLRTALDHLPPTSWHPRTLPAVTALTARLRLAANDVTDAERIAAGEQPPGADQGAAWGLLLCVRGEVALVLGDHDAALRWSGRAGRVLRVRGWTNPALAPWQSLAAVATAALGDTETARELTLEAGRRAARWGAPSVIVQTSLLAGRVGRRGSVTGAGHALSIADQRIAALAAAGRTAAEIAGLLVVPATTVRRRLAAIRGALAETLGGGDPGRGG
ncbi:AAA family ATPase [Actinophytocola oryzae]|uniref:AAA ATPase-like protein n=1 Tax=Actinophytocola oryzae TaxID=502181 RepID=A0A4R7VFU3_9PSEU|nr:ATP-binding protein [Actinophytocola oryzae]TDV47985.1 AAA ATPase-like protein [Actinophytocola oryzae]